MCENNYARYTLKQLFTSMSVNSADIYRTTKRLAKYPYPRLAKYPRLLLMLLLCNQMFLCTCYAEGERSHYEWTGKILSCPSSTKDATLKIARKSCSNFDKMNFWRKKSTYRLCKQVKSEFPRWIGCV